MTALRAWFVKACDLRIFWWLRLAASAAIRYAWWVARLDQFGGAIRWK